MDDKLYYGLLVMLVALQNQFSRIIEDRPWLVEDMNLREDGTGRTFYQRTVDFEDLNKVKERLSKSCPSSPTEFDFGSLNKWKRVNRSIGFKEDISEDIIKTLLNHFNSLGTSRKSIMNKWETSVHHAINFVFDESQQRVPEAMAHPNSTVHTRTARRPLSQGLFSTADLPPRNQDIHRVSSQSSTRVPEAMARPNSTVHTRTARRPLSQSDTGISHSATSAQPDNESSEEGNG